MIAGLSWVKYSMMSSRSLNICLKESYQAAFTYPPALILRDILSMIPWLLRWLFKLVLVCFLGMVDPRDTCNHIPISQMSLLSFQVFWGSHIPRKVCYNESVPVSYRQIGKMFCPCCLLRWFFRVVLLCFFLMWDPSDTCNISAVSNAKPKLIPANVVGIGYFKENMRLSQGQGLHF